MRLHEHEAADIFEKLGIPVPRRGLASSPEEARLVAKDLSYPVMVKAQVLVGGRGLAGGIKDAKDEEELEKVCGQLLGKEIKGLKVETVLITQKVPVEREMYMGITVDGFEGKPVVIASMEGGVHIEKAAEKSPGAVASVSVDPFFGFHPYHARGLLRQIGMTGPLLGKATGVLTQLYKAFSRYEALICEINPLAMTPEGSFMALDAVLEVDDSAVGRLKGVIPDPKTHLENPLEKKGKEIGVTYLDLDGDIGIISSGAGLGMTSMDIIGDKLKPANFLETGGGITEELLYRCMELVTSKPGLKALLINVYGGINPIHEGAKGVVRFIKERDLKIPVVAKALGNRQEETWEILRSGGVHVVTETPTEKAVEKLFEVVGMV
ncbi:MAG: succinate--CoA ligase subunit beta [Deltaproteobacteria bacterium]|nr:succinate--CoA ligase subunit beta [Deltaproteobacteria bacterium]MBW2121298.1 succinate--CoA ligase subunit beta [Deltaproteobacteria bacterium]HDZ91674.1 succinate--CoA ligase subunit beta [Deltaproteobacteria bacterium]